MVFEILPGSALGEICGSTTIWSLCHFFGRPRLPVLLVCVESVNLPSLGGKLNFSEISPWDFLGLQGFGSLNGFLLDCVESVNSLSWGEKCCWAEISPCDFRGLPRLPFPSIEVESVNPPVLGGNCCWSWWRPLPESYCIKYRDRDAHFTLLALLSFWKWNQFTHKFYIEM